MKIFFSCSHCKRLEQFTKLFVQATSIDTFKNRLDRFWENQEFKYDYTADLIGAGSRSEFNMK